VKKKDIEKIPFLTLPKRSRKKAVKYIGVTAWKNIGHKRHLILEMYRNEKGHQDVPVMRYVANADDWGVYFPEDERWTHQKIATNDYYNGFAWNKAGEHDQYGDRPKANLLYDEKDLERIKKFFKDVKIWREERWWDYFEHHESNLKSKRESRKYELRRERLEQRKAETPELPEKKLLGWAQNNLFHEKHFLYYKKRGRYATICCSKCGGVKEGAWKVGESYESTFQTHVEEPKNKRTGKCPLCGAYGIYKPQGKTKGKYTEESYAFTADRYKEHGAVIRYVQLEHSWHLDEIIGDKGEPEMYGAHEEFSGVEIAREYLEPGKKPQRDFHKHDPYLGKDFWDDCNLYGMSNIPIHAGSIHPEMKEALKGTFLQYSGLDLYVAAVGETNVLDYIERYTQYPQMEMLMKMGLIEVVRDMVKGYCGLICDSKAKRADLFLGINKNHVKDLIAEKGDTEFLRILRWEKNLGKSWTAEQVKNISQVIQDYSSIKLENALKYMSMEQLINRIEKYAGTKFEASRTCYNALSQLKHITSVYLDYLDMRITMGYDLNNSVYAYPRSLENAHAKMVMEQNKNKQDERLEEVKKSFPDIRKKYRKLRNQYFYEDDNLVIRPARSAEEIVQEGRILHHCVGGNSYLRNHNEGKSLILVLRAKDTPDLPYITVEMKPDTFNIVQWYGAYDKKPDEKNIQSWLKAYTTRLKCQKDGTMKEAGQQASQVLLMAAV